MQMRLTQLHLGNLLDRDLDTRYLHNVDPDTNNFCKVHSLKKKYLDTDKQ